MTVFDAPSFFLSNVIFVRVHHNMTGLHDMLYIAFGHLQVCCVDIHHHCVVVNFVLFHRTMSLVACLCAFKGIVLSTVNGLQVRATMSMRETSTCWRSMCPVFGWTLFYIAAVCALIHIQVRRWNEGGRRLWYDHSEMTNCG